MKQYPGQFILIEGADLTGKSTLINSLVTALSGDDGRGPRQVFTAEPTGGQYGRKALESTDPIERGKFFTADRREHISGILRPYLEAGSRVVSDRGIMSTMAYQTAEMRLSGDPRSTEGIIEGIMELQPPDYPEPNLVLLLYAPPSLLNERREQKRYKYNREIKQKIDGNVELQQLVYENYMRIYAMGIIPNIQLIYAGQSSDEVLDESLAYVSEICVGGDVTKWK